MNNSLQNKFLNFEVPPPAGVWEKIADALNESELTLEFPSKLYHAETIPPVSAWNKIAASLDAVYEPAKKGQRRISPIIKYAAAAVVIGFAAWGSIQLLTNQPGNKGLVKQEIVQPEKDNFVPSTDQQIKTPDENFTAADNSSFADEARNDAALEASKKTFAKLDLPLNSRIKEIASGFHFASSIDATNITQINPAEEIAPGNLANRYMTLITPEGNIIRMSNKLKDMVCCVSGEEVDEACKDQIKKWREKIICSPNCHTTGSFMDMLSLVDALQDN